MNQRGFAHLFVVIILLAGISLSVYLVQTKTNLFPWATSNPISGPIPTPFPTPTATPDQTALGQFGTVVNAGGVIDGWAYDPDQPSSEQIVTFDIDNETDSFMTRTDNTWNYINAKYNLTGNHAFRTYLPEKYRNGQTHTIRGYVLDYPTKTRRELVGSPSNFTAPQPTRNFGLTINPNGIDITLHRGEQKHVFDVTSRTSNYFEFYDYAAVPTTADWRSNLIWVPRDWGSPRPGQTVSLDLKAAVNAPLGTYFAINHLMDKNKVKIFLPLKVTIIP